MITVYTALFTDDINKTYGKLHEYGFTKDDFPYDIEFVAFTNCPYLTSDLWDIRVVDIIENSPRREARKYKILSHKYFPNSTMTLWMDNSCFCCVDFKAVLDHYLQNHDWAVHLHIDRTTISQEADICSKMGLDNAEIIQNQVDRYVNSGYDINDGYLYETGITMRRNNLAVIEANELWWNEVSSYSVRDQISLPWVFDQVSSLTVNKIPMTFCAHESALNRTKTTHFKTEPRHIIAWN